jgi:hypothetical protein
MGRNEHDELGVDWIMVELTARSGRSRARHGDVWVRVSLAFAAAAAVAALAGCSSSSSSGGNTTSTSSGLAAYCADRTNLENSIKGLTSLNASSGVSGLTSQLDAVQSAATKLVNSAKGDFPTQTSAITSSMNALKSSVAGLASNPTPGQIATITKDAASMVSAVQSFMVASSSKCS